MGLSIHYSGSFNPVASLADMIEEVKEIAEIYHWKYFVFEQAFPENSLGKEEYNEDIYGICFTPPGCETVSLSFLSNGRMSDLVHLKSFGMDENQEERSCLYALSVKTQYAGIEIHKLIIHLLKYLDKKYWLDFKVTDEGQYWETGDEELLKETFKRYTDLMDNFATSIEIYPMHHGESFIDYFERLLKQMRDKRKG